MKLSLSNCQPRKKRMSRSKYSEEEELIHEDKRLAELMRSVKPKLKGGFHSPKHKTENRHKEKENLKKTVREYNAGTEVE